MTFNKGSLIQIDYTAKVKDSEDIFETTIEEEAKKHNIHDPNSKYQPKLVSVGESWVLKGLDEALEKAETGQNLTVEVPPEKGFGERDTGKVRMIPLRKLGEDAEKVSVGDTIEIEGRKGIVRFIGSGRVQVDFNHRYAGKTIVYDVKIIKSLESDEDKILGILKRHVPLEDSKLVFKKEDSVLDVTIPEEIFRADGLQIMKHFIQMDIFKFVPSLEKVNFIETYVNKQKKSEETKDKEQEKKTESQEQKSETVEQKTK
ncbi:MAG: peptidylprolyl isomerase [Nitrosopumilaceae archaeon]|nr:peptidylprolyl isomerase [Nitrosopumilaceae archaeon]NIU00819.1 peptidylprolyl isomerase [Nitrosopumilaceae archaeon]NIU87272.1 peptidylprolyl isomerase [Nitrosopumilaceae archaeon]NIV65800.1 peptidylprolyl isomerase [Nitrosopumilaceae archaeon]NIX61421.1 peptidylprolyl isomerase [Nitrosopumilaceae archaeon]